MNAIFNVFLSSSFRYHYHKDEKYVPIPRRILWHWYFEHFAHSTFEIQNDKFESIVKYLSKKFTREIVATWWHKKQIVQYIKPTSIYQWDWSLLTKAHGESLQKKIDSKFLAAFITFFLLFWFEKCLKILNSLFFSLRHGGSFYGWSLKWKITKPKMTRFFEAWNSVGKIHMHVLFEVSWTTFK